ncbi:hypothetical protein PS15m_009584 [Mucor circinelloides]
MEYFKCAHPSKWDFESYKEHLAQGKTRQPNLRLLVTKYKHGLQLMKRFGDLSQEHMEIIDELIDNCYIGHIIATTIKTINTTIASNLLYIQ